MQEEPTTTPNPEDAFRPVAVALGRRDLDAALTIFVPDAVWDTSKAGGLGGVYEGREAIRGFLQAWIGPFEVYEQVVEEFRDLGNGVTLNVDLTRGRPTGGSGFVEQRFAAVSTSRDGLIERIATYADIEKARAAAERLAQERGSVECEHADDLDLVAICRDVFLAANDEERLEASLPYVSADVIWDTGAWDPMGGGIYEGVPAVAAFLKSWWSTWEDHDHYVEEIEDMGGGVIFAVAREDGRIKGSKGRVEQTNGWIFEWANGLNVRVTLYRDPDQARAAAERLAQKRG